MDLGEKMEFFWFRMLYALWKSPEGNGVGCMME